MLMIFWFIDYKDQIKCIRWYFRQSNFEVLEIRLT